MFDALKASKFTTTPFLNSWHLSLSENLTFIYVRSKQNFPIYRHLLNPIAADEQFRNVLHHPAGCKGQSAEKKSRER